MTKRAPSLMQRIISRLLSSPQGNGDALDLDHLTRLVRRYAVEQQQVPKDLEELVAHNYLKAIPPAPEGHKFVVDRKAVEVRLD